MSTQRTLWSDLRSIDRAIVPRLAAMVARFQRGFRDFGPTVDHGRGGPRQTTKRLDRRYARRGTLALIADVPQVGLAALTLLLVIAAVTVASRTGDSGDDAGGLDLPTVAGPAAQTVGPFPGESVAGYLADSKADLLARAQQNPTERTFALANFDRALTPALAAQAVPGVEVHQIFLQVKAGGATQYFPSTNVDFHEAALTKPLQVKGLPAAAGPVYDAVAAALSGQANELTRFATTIPPEATQEELIEKASQLADAGVFRAAATALRARCACIYAVVIRAEAQTLANIANSGKVRVVEPAIADVAYSRLKWVPLPPDIKDGELFRSSGS